MGLARRGKKGTWQHFRRVPKRFSRIDGRKIVRTSLGTDNLQLAKVKAAQVEINQDLIWEAALAGKDEWRDAAYRHLRAIATSHGVPYLPASQIANLPLKDVLQRVELADETVQSVEIDAILGAAPVPNLKLSSFFEQYEEFIKDRLATKTEDQLRRWRAPRTKAVRNLINVIGDEDVEFISRQQILQFRNWWWDRIKTGEVTANSANKDLTYLSAMYKELSQALGQDWRNPFHGLRFREVEGRRAVFSNAWIRNRLLQPAALDGLNSEARVILLLMVNTGARPSELIGLLPHHIQLDAPIPHIQIRAEGRELKTRYSERELPVLGVSLDALQACPTGFPHYRAKPSNWSAATTKYLRENGLLETPEHSPYALRHSLSDRLQNAGCEDRTRKEIMGHRPEGIIYGAGSSLETKRDWLIKVAF